MTKIFFGTVLGSLVYVSSSFAASGAGCLEGFCVGKPVSTFPAGVHFSEPDTHSFSDPKIRDLNANLAKAKKEKNFVSEAENDLKNSLERVKKAYVAPDAALKKIAQYDPQVESGNLRGTLADASVLPALAQVKAACQPMDFRFFFLSKSGFPTSVHVAWAAVDDSGKQELRIEKIVRDFSKLSNEERKALKPKVEKEIGIELDGDASPKDHPTATYGSELRILAPHPLEFAKNQKLLATNPACAKKLSVN